MIKDLSGEVANNKFRYPPYHSSQRTVLNWVMAKWGPNSLAPTVIKIAFGGVALGILNVSGGGKFLGGVTKEALLFMASKL